jgi:4-hydroxybenzoate polyprenyltransferase
VYVSILKASRPLNLLIIGFTQFVFYIVLFASFSDEYDLVLFPNLLLPFIIVTVLISSGGYLINDYFDLSSDAYNSKTKSKLSSSVLLKSYFTILIIGWVLSLYIAYVIGDVKLSIIYLFASAILYLYSSHFKNLPLIGNIIVSIFSVFVLLIILYAESAIIVDSAWQSQALEGRAIPLLVFYSLIIFILSFARELIKDVEDIKGDQEVGSRTYPIVSGIPNALRFVSLITFSGVLIVIIWLIQYFRSYSLIENSWLILTILLPLISIMYYIRKADNQSTVHNLSTAYKLIMVAGLIYINIIAWT